MHSTLLRFEDNCPAESMIEEDAKRSKQDNVQLAFTLFRRHCVIG